MPRDQPRMPAGFKTGGRWTKSQVPKRPKELKAAGQNELTQVIDDRITDEILDGQYPSILKLGEKAARAAEQDFNRGGDRGTARDAAADVIIDNEATLARVAATIGTRHQLSAAATNKWLQAMASQLVEYAVNEGHERAS